jgi:hypothetical protein
VATWEYTFTPTDLGNLETAFASESLDFSAEQNFVGAINTGVTTLDIQVTPEPSTILVFSTGIAGIALLRRFRKS